MHQNDAKTQSEIGVKSFAPVRDPRTVGRLAELGADALKFTLANQVQELLDADLAVAILVQRLHLESQAINLGKESAIID